MAKKVKKKRSLPPKVAARAARVKAGKVKRDRSGRFVKGK